jgi:hypothetical protein
VTRSAEIFLGVIAAATLLMAIVQVSVIVVAGLLARRMMRLVDQVERELAPLFANVNAIGRDASRATALAVAQVERVDRLVGDLVARVERVVASVPPMIGGPAREGRAMMAALRAMVAALRDARRGRKRRGDDEDALFI